MAGFIEKGKIIICVVDLCVKRRKELAITSEVERLKY